LTFGVVPTGFNPKLLQNILQELSDDQKADISPLWDTSSDSPTGQQNGTFARQLALGWEALNDSYDGFDPDKAQDASLVAVSKITGTVPRAASYTTIVCTVNLDLGTTLVSGTHFANVTGNPSVRATPLADYTAAAGGSQPVTFRAELPGPVVITAATLSSINTPVTGWHSVTNALDGVTGLPADSNESLRARRFAELSKAGKTTEKALRATLLALKVNGVEPILSCSVLVNDTDRVDADGLLPHSIECVVNDSPAVASDLLAQTIWDNKAPGVTARGGLSGTATDSDGDTHSVGFSRPSVRAIYLSYSIKISSLSLYVGDAAFKQSVADSLRTRAGAGVDVLFWDAQLAAAQSGVGNAAVTLGFSASPTGIADLPIGARELADFDTSRIVVTHV
jgi:hypothetical protein